MSSNESSKRQARGDGGEDKTVKLSEMIQGTKLKKCDSKSFPFEYFTVKMCDCTTRTFILVLVSYNVH